MYSICSMSEKVIVSTRLDDEACGRTYTIDTDGISSPMKQFVMQRGTIVSAYQLFRKFPVRRQNCLKNATKSNRNALEIVKR